MVRFFSMNSQLLVSAALALAVSPCCGGAAPAPAEPAEPSLSDEPGEGAGESPKVREAKAAIGRGEFASAKELLESVVVEAPDDAQAQFYLAVACEGIEDRDGAVEAYRRAIAIDPKLIDAYVNLSALLLDVEDASGSADVSAQGLKIAADHPDLLTNSALALELAEKYDDALVAYGQAVEASPSNYELRFAYADLLARSDKPAQAKAQLKQVLDGSSDMRVLAAAGHVLGTLDSFAECVAAYDKALGVEKNPQLHVRRGLCRHGLKDDKGAQLDFEAALKLDPKNAPAHYYLGRHLARSNKSVACEHLSKAKELGEGAVVKSAQAWFKKVGCR